MDEHASLRQDYPLPRGLLDHAFVRLFTQRGRNLTETDLHFQRRKPSGIGFFVFLVKVYPKFSHTGGPIWIYQIRLSEKA